jgi:hypothetical protein
VPHLHQIDRRISNEPTETISRLSWLGTTTYLPTPLAALNEWGRPFRVGQNAVWSMRTCIGACTYLPLSRKGNDAARVIFLDIVAPGQYGDEGTCASRVRGACPFSRVLVGVRLVYLMLRIL